MTSFSKTVSTTSIDAPSSRQSFEAANRADDAKAEPRNSSMVTNERPVPALHPSPDMGCSVDRAAFNAAWEDEARNARRQAFKAKRNYKDPQTRHRNFSRTVNR